MSSASDYSDYDSEEEKVTLTFADAKVGRYLKTSIVLVYVKFSNSIVPRFFM